MSCRFQKRRKINRVISFMLMLVMVVTMLPLFSMSRVNAAEAVKQVTLLSTGLTSSDTSICKISKNSGVTWNSTEKCAVFNGNTSYLQLTNPFKNVTESTGISIKMEAYIYSDTSGYSRLFEISDGTSVNNMLLNAGKSAHLSYITRVDSKSNSENICSVTQKQSLYNAWHTYELIFYPGGTSKLFVDGVCASKYDTTPVNSVYTKTLNRLSSWNTVLIGTSLWQLYLGYSDGYLHGKIRNLTLTSGAVYHVDISNNGRGSSSYDRQYVTFGGRATRPASDPTADGNVFVDWVDSATSNTEYNFNKVLTEDTSIYARWHQYTITVDDNKLIATCTGDTAADCTNSTTPIEASLNIESVFFSPNKSMVSPSVIGQAQFANATGVSISDPEYYIDEELTVKTNASNSGATIDGGVPFNVGNYYATISAGDKKAVVPFSILASNSDKNFSTESLNNLYENQTGGGIAQKVSGDNPTSTLKVILMNESDRVNLYKLADISWNSTNSAYGNVTWNSSVTEWFLDSDYASSDIATDPLAISNMTSTLESEFFSSLLSKDDGVIKDATPTFINDDASVQGALGEGGTYYTSFENIPAGMYAVIAEGSYSPVVISIFPYQNGPTADWYLDSEYTARLKYSAADVNKWINESDISNTVAYRDTVVFDIDFTFPSLYTDRVTLVGDGTDTSLDYKLYAFDTMSPAFSLINTSESKPVITYSTKSSKGLALPAEVEYFEFADETYTGAEEKVAITGDNYSDYLYNGDHLINNFEGEALYAVSKSAPIYTIGEPEISDDGVTTQSITFNVHALKAFAKANSINMSEFVLTMHYEATVTDKLKICSDDNTNEIVLHYEETPEKMTKIEDVVYGYSYGLQVIKIDGTKSTEESTVYLLGAQFKLYKEVETKPEDMTDVYTYDDNGVDRYFVAVTNIFTDTTSNLDEDGVFTTVSGADGIILKGLKEGNYILKETSAPFGYNTLAEDIYFEINKLEKEDADNHYGGRYKIFKEMEVTDQEPIYNENGIVSLSVRNYRGLTLPSTGGAGTLIFTVIGVMMMLIVIVILVVRKQTRITENYM